MKTERSLPRKPSGGEYNVGRAYYNSQHRLQERISLCKSLGISPDAVVRLYSGGEYTEVVATSLHPNKIKLLIGTFDDASSVYILRDE